MTERHGGIEAFSGIQTGERPARIHHFAFVAEREPDRCALLVGREIRDDWELEGQDESTAATRVLARADEVFLPLDDGTPDEQLERFTRGFRQVMVETQHDLQSGWKDREGQAPSLGLTLGYLDQRRLHIGQVGHDPSYLIRRGRMHRITPTASGRSVDSEQPLVRDPRLTSKDLDVVGGFSDDLNVRTLGLMLEPGDIVLLCTQGVTAEVREPILEEAVLAACRGEEAESLDALADSIFRIVPEHSKTDRAIALARLPRPGNQKNEAFPAGSDR